MLGASSVWVRAKEPTDKRVVNAPIHVNEIEVVEVGVPGVAPPRRVRDVRQIAGAGFAVADMTSLGAYMSPEQRECRVERSYWRAARQFALCNVSSRTL
jgi:hypothetical protein